MDDPKIYIRGSQHSYEGKDIDFVTLERDRAFDITDEEAGTMDEWISRIWVWQGEELLETYEWTGIGGWKPRE